ncbi:MAG: pectinesterase, partial [Chitinophagaceae bacterium]
KVYIKWIADETSPIINEGTDNDGTAVTNVYVFADKDIPADNDAPVLVSVLPAAASSSATINGSVIVTFNEKVKTGSGDITLDAKVLSGVYGSKTATFTYEKLSYDTEYTFTIPTGALTDLSGNVYAGTVVKFRTGKRSEPTKKLFDAVVAKDGSGDYTSVIDAIAAAPSGRTQPWLIFIKNGSYKGHHVISKPFIHLIGQSRVGVIIKDSLNANNGAISDRSTMVVQSSDVYFENFTLENSHGYATQSGPMAEALNTDKDRFAMKNVYVRSYQDTWMTGGSISRQYVLNSRIEGAVDFIYGSGDIFFDKDTMTVTKAGSYIVAPSHSASTSWGYVFRDNVINQNKDKV